MNQLRHQTSPRNISHHIQLSTRWRILKSLKNVTKVSSKTPIEVPAPKFEVTVSGYTTYDRYLAGDLNEANNLNKRLLVEGRKVELGISNDILKCDNYKSLLTYSSVKYSNGDLGTFYIGENATNEITYDNVSYNDSQWGSYAFNASVTFDGYTAKDEHLCHITGLPYTANPPNATEWETNQGTVSFNDGHARLGDWSWSNPHSMKKTGFKIPEDVKIMVASEFQIPNASVDPDYNIYVSGNQIVNYGSQENDSRLSTSKSATMTKDNPIVICESSWGSGSSHVKVYTLSLTYSSR